MEQQASEPTTDNIIVLKFADAKVPVFKESKNRDFILYGDDNKYPAYLKYLYDKSAKHNAIIGGKAFYIFGKGFANGELIINGLNESLNDIVEKCILDIELYGGFKVEGVYNGFRKITELYHVDFDSVRKSKDGKGFYYNGGKEWTTYTRKEDIAFIPAFNPLQPYGNFIYEYNEYRPGAKFYPLPEYLGSNNYIECDVEISKFYLSSIKNGMTPSKVIQFFEGEPTEEKKAEIEQRMTKKFAGSENAGKFILVFSKSKDKAVEISDVSYTDLDKLFNELNKTIQQEVFTGHRVVSPMLFGIKTEGQLGGNTELKTAYTLFQNTYSRPKAKKISKELSYLLSYSTYKQTYDLLPTEPIGLQFDVKDVINFIPTGYILDVLGVPKEVQPAQITQPGQAPNAATAPIQTASVNENLKNLTGKQQQQIERILRKYKNQNLTEAQARVFLKSGYSLTDEEINILLGITQTVAASKFSDEDIESTIAVFDSFGDSKEDFEILKSKPVAFSIDQTEQDESIFKEDAFKGYDVTTTEAKIIELIKKDSLITPKAISETIGQTESYVTSKIQYLIKKGYITEAEKTIGTDTAIERTIINTDLTAPDVTLKKKPITEVLIKYSYEGPQDNRNRPFCAKLMQLNRLYSRGEIEQISARLGYSVFDRRGGFWRHKDGTTTPYCRHKWKANIVIKK